MAGEAAAGNDVTGRDTAAKTVDLRGLQARASFVVETKSGGFVVSPCIYPLTPPLILYIM